MVLIRFAVSNFRSIHDPVELSMVAIDRDRDAAREATELGPDLSLLTTAGIFGPNASGKSNIISAIAWLVEAVRTSVRTWDEEIPIEPFAFSNRPQQTANFSVDLLIDGVRFEYLIELDSQEIHYEALFHYPKKKRRRIFQRDRDDLELQRGLGKLSGIRKLLTKRTLVVSLAKMFGDSLLADFARELDRTEFLRVPTHFAFFRSPRSSRTRRIFDTPVQDAGAIEASKRREQALSLLKFADLGIDDVLVETEKVLHPEEAEPRTLRRLRLVHRTDHDSVPLDFEQESDGTKAWFGLVGPVLSALDAGSLLLADELNASLHPTLCARLIELFQRSDINPKGAQLVFTSHDASLLAHLNRDEVWLTEKPEDGATRLGPLSEFAGERVRRSQNLEAGYLHGRFGALPNVDQAELLRALGRIG